MKQVILFGNADCLIIRSLEGIGYKVFTSSTVTALRLTVTDRHQAAIIFYHTPRHRAQEAQKMLNQHRCTNPVLQVFPEEPNFAHLRHELKRL